MAETHHLQRRGQTWHYYRRVPLTLVSVIGRSFIKRSLGTKDLKAAKILRNILNVQIDAEFSAAEQTPASPAAIKPSSLAALTAHFRQHIESLDERSAARLTTDPPESGDQKSEMIADVEFALQILKSRDAPRATQWIDSTSDKLMSTHGKNLTDKEIVAGFAEIVRRGLIELQNRKLDRLEDKYNVGPHDPFFDPKNQSEVTFGALAEIFWEERLADYQTNGISIKRSDKTRAELDFLLEAIGEDRPMREITDDVVQLFRKLLARTPSNRKKLYPKLTPEQAADRAAKDCKPILSPTTQGLYLDCLRNMLAVGLRKGLLLNNPAADAKPIKRNTMSAAEKRMPWTSEQITGFFHGKFYNACLPTSPKPYAQKDRGWRFWVPLIMLLSGARPMKSASFTQQT